MGGRCKILRISTHLFADLFQQGSQHYYEVVKDGLPPNTRIVGAQMGPDFREVIFLLQSDEFEETQEGMPYSEILPQFRTLSGPEPVVV